MKQFFLYWGSGCGIIGYPAMVISGVLAWMFGVHILPTVAIGFVFGLISSAFVAMIIVMESLPEKVPNIYGTI